LIILLPLSYPISKLLDYLLGRELGTIYSRNELKKLLEMHSTYSDITKDETTIMSGVLDFGRKEVSEVMTPLEDVFMMNIDDNLNIETISKMLEMGYSRVPVYEASPERVTGLLFVKDLALLNPQDNIPVRKILQMYGRNLPRIFADTPLAEVLAEFKRGRSHIALVRRIKDEGGGDPVYENVGIVTLEDVIEEILQDEIIDETDVYGKFLFFYLNF
jgi:metal transporter CNNM